MSANAFATRLRADFDAIESRLPADVVPPEARRGAVERLADWGLPGLRDDEWRYTNLRALHGAASLQPQTVGDGRDAAVSSLPVRVPGAIRLVFIDGALAPGLSDALLADGPLAALAPERGVAAPSSDQRFALLNDAFAVDAVRHAVRGQACVELCFFASGTAPVYPRVELQLERGSNLTLIERHLGAGSTELLVNVKVALRIGPGARCRHVRLQDFASAALMLDQLSTHLADDARYELVQVHLGGASLRSTVVCELDGRGAGVDVAVASMADGTRVNDTTVRVCHHGRNTASRQVLRALAGDRARVAFHSSVTVAATAGGADSGQSLKGLIGGATAEVNLRPQLEIDTDDVKANHGATTGTLDETALFYLLSRGIDRDTARLLLEWAFIEAALAHIPLPALRREAEERTVARLGNRAAAELLQ